MKNQVKFMVLAIVILQAGLSIRAQADLSVRQALYFMNPKAVTIDFKNDKLATVGSTLSVPSELAESCDGGFCKFRVGVMILRSGNIASIPSGFAIVSADGRVPIGNSFSFGPTQAAREFFLPVKLRYGVNRITFVIDPHKKTQETDESNNTFSVTVTVERPRGRTRRQ